MHWFVEFYKGVDDEAWAPYEPSWLGVGEEMDPGIGEMWASPPRGGGGGGEG